MRLRSRPYLTLYLHFKLAPVFHRLHLHGEEYYVQEIFDSAELLANLDRNAVKVEHSVYDYIVYDSTTIEKPFALALDRDPDVKMFFKIPERFKIETPIGTYNPDWAVYLTRNGEEKLYFILETKGTTNLFDLRTPEQLKIRCGHRPLSNRMRFTVAGVSRAASLRMVIRSGNTR